MVVDINELTKELKELREIKEKYENLTKSFHERTSKIYENLAEINVLLSELNPNILIKNKERRKSQRHGPTNQTVSEILFYLREHPTEEITMKWISDKYQIFGGTAQDIKMKLSQHPEIKTREDPNYKRRTLFSYQENIQIPNYIPSKLSETIKKEEERAFGVVEESKYKKSQS